MNAIPGNCTSQPSQSSPAREGVTGATNSIQRRIAIAANFALLALVASFTLALD